MPQTPYLVQGTIYTSRGTVPDSIVTVNSDLSVTTDSEGKFVMDLANLDDGYTAEASYTIEAKDEFNNEYKTDTITVTGGGQTKNLILEDRNRNSEQGYLQGKVMPVLIRGIGDKPSTKENPMLLQIDARPVTIKQSGTTTKYIGEAAPGTPASSASWRIKKYITTTGEVTWANGNSEFDKVWNSRASYSYS